MRTNMSCSASSREVVDLFGFGLYGAVLQANYSSVSADELADQLTDLVDIVLSQSA